MARASSGSGSGYAWALVIFGAGFVICLLLMIVFYAQVGGAEQRAGDAERALGKFVTPAEARSQEVQALLGDRAGGTVVGKLVEETMALKKMISGDPQVAAEGLTNVIEEAGVSGTLLDEVNRLGAEFQAANDRADTAGKERDEALAVARAAEEKKNVIKKTFTDAEGVLTERANDAINEAESYLDKINAMDDKFQKEFAKIRAEMQTVIDEKDQEMQEQRREIVVLNKKIRELIGDGGFEIAPVTTADGRIVSIIPEEDKVFIDRGRADRVLLGMTFEVYDSGEIVKIEEFEQLRGKATIEVINLAEGNSVCRVVRRQRGETIKSGDGIVNLVYDPNARLKFRVFGVFDIESDGGSDRKRVEAMVSRWGGRLVEQLSPDVDFLVLGAEPPQPQPLPSDEIDPVKIKEFVAETKAFETWLNLKGEAQALSVPILNQNRFLSLVGYYMR